MQPSFYVRRGDGLGGGHSWRSLSRGYLFCRREQLIGDGRVVVVEGQISKGTGSDTERHPLHLLLWRSVFSNSSYLGRK
jgi:hypothetical protein